MKRAAHLLAVLCVVALAATLAAAKKPPKPPDGGDTGGGTIYFRTGDAGDELWSMNSDGSAKTPLPVSLGGAVFGVEPSRHLHGGHRWFLKLREVGIYPDGRPQVELFAPCDDGATSVQLTSDAHLEGLCGSLRWVSDEVSADVAASWLARRWDSDTGELVEAGIYALGITWVNDTPVPASQGPILRVPLDIFDAGAAGWRPDTQYYDWSPDGTKIVYDRMCAETGGLFALDFVTGVSSQLTPDGWAPVWSPDGGTIAFGSRASGVCIETIGVTDPQHTRKVILPGTDTKKGGIYNRDPVWSPSGSHIAYTHKHVNLSSNFLWRAYVHRAEADGSRDTNLSRDIGDWAAAVAWR